jgi:hypothetical protein
LEVQSVISRAGVTGEHLLRQLLIYLVQDALEGREAAAERARVQDEVDLGDLEPARLRLEDIAAEVFAIFDLERDAFALLGDGRARLDLVVTIAASVAVRGHDQDVLCGTSSVQRTNDKIGDHECTWK